MSALAVRSQRKTVPLQAVPAPAPQATALAQFAQVLARTLMEGVHDAANLNVATVHALLAPTDGSLQSEWTRLTESWRFSWRTYEIAATTAASVMRLAEAHSRNSVDLLWATFEQAADGDATLDGSHIDRLRETFESLRAAQAAAFDAAIEAHRSLIAIATEVR
jgi:hypothetical protein